MDSPPTTMIFLALEPDAATSERIWRDKRRVRQLVGDQLYLEDPPHMTLYLACFAGASVAEAVGIAENISRETEAVELSIVGWHAFEGDALTSRNTLVMEFDGASEARLRKLQQRLVEQIAPLRDAAATRARIAGRLDCLSAGERRSAEACGFPFVGAGWHPHFTIASIAPADWPQVTAALLPNSPTGIASCSVLKVYELVDGMPRELKAFPLKRTAGIDMTSLKQELTDEIWSVVDRYDWILSATITGSFLTDDSLAAISDIDLVLVVDSLNGPRFDVLHEDFGDALGTVLARRGLDLKINSTLGPRKLNDDATAVLHLMLYSHEGHHQHVIKSPFTCLDWQRSVAFRKKSMAAIYPVFGLQPHHFVSARRGIRDYLHDFERGVVSYRELECSADGYEELKREEPMAIRDRYEYAYHVMRFLMQNLLKLVRRRNAAPDGDQLLWEFFEVFPRDASVYGPTYLELRRRKKARDFSEPIPHLTEKLRQFVLDFESQFRIAFIETATRHIAYRHAPTKLNGGSGDRRHFLGRLDPAIEAVSSERLADLVEAATDFDTAAVFASPLAPSCRQSLELLRANVSAPTPTCDDRLLEIDYGSCDGLEIREARRRHPELFAAWNRGEDPRFPQGENTADVIARIRSFADETWTPASGNTIVCTHNVVLRCLVGECLGVPRESWTRIQVPHLAPITFVRTKEFGLFVDLEESVERPLLADFLYRIERIAELAA